MLTPLQTASVLCEEYRGSERNSGEPRSFSFKSQLYKQCSRKEFIFSTENAQNRGLLDSTRGGTHQSALQNQMYKIHKCFAHDSDI